MSIKNIIKADFTDITGEKTRKIPLIKISSLEENIYVFKLNSQKFFFIDS